MPLTQILMPFLLWFVEKQIRYKEREWVREKKGKEEKKKREEMEKERRREKGGEEKKKIKRHETRAAIIFKRVPDNESVRDLEH